MRRTSTALAASIVVIAVLAVGEARNGLRAFNSCGKDRRQVALTFDDGIWVPGFNALLMELKRFKIHATFLCTPAADGDDAAELKKRCEMIGQAIDQGHSVQMHSWKHDKIDASKSNKELGAEIERQRAWLTKCGATPTQIRPPYGIMTEAQAAYLSREKGLVVAMWNVEPNDAEDGKAKESGPTIFKRVMDDFRKRVGDGNSAVILLHDRMMEKRLGMIKMLYDAFSKMGYEFVTTEACYKSCRKDVCIGSGGPLAGKGVLVLKD